MSSFIKIIFLLSIFSSLWGHQTGLSYLEIKENKNAEINIVYKIPLQDSQADEIKIVFPPECQQASYKTQTIVDGFIIEKYSLACSEEGLLNSRIWIDGLLKNDKGVLIHYEKAELSQTTLLRATTPYMLINQEESKFKVFKEYFNLGVVHILLGFDHLLFVLSLILLISNTKTLLYSITAFTLAHSITLAFGILNIVDAPIAYVEAMIALSIIFLARELLISKVSFTSKNLGLVTFIFGLLHGFGFSSVLSDIGLPQEEIPLALFSFNLGIEAGQLAFIAVSGVVILISKRYVKNHLRGLKTTLAYAIGTLSAFWLIERVVAF